MTLGACAITIFHPPADPAGLGRWVAEYIASAGNAPGYLSARESVPGSGHLDFAVEVTFEHTEQLHEWLDGSERDAVLRDGQAHGFWCAAELILAEGELPPTNAGVFLHRVARGKESEFVSAQSDLTLVSARFPGYEGTVLFPADSSGHWMSVLRFRTAGQLNAWIRSRERQEALPRLRNELTHDFAELPRSAPFGSTVRVADGETKITPGWKSAMLVVLCLYPTVMLLSKTLAPALGDIGANPAAAMFVGNVVSVALLQWVLVPAASRPFRRWLDPIDGAPARISAVGTAVVAAACAALLVMFCLIG
ncbi:antibiotic biosynthesis monooxygenase [Mycobacterium bourgelatii]|uniref:Antibiotic biosynthesis monooxygenase n=1 Tax=Mycobacterium bourgelatii TaxID=1273442 RepID=A0A7I9YPL0_MYCBU|nr:antibiotic biosynthesis monooxygenase [Mycobacterium bourgelatii]MCV6973772.1 antibiotic biosynthesis monooxygenase [Mycobacterium bourgelatii]GFG90616.1 antibiotic biosynthesis monooxygenase [Mycobacterium bourgelatii]